MEPILIWGAGAMGGTIGALFKRIGLNVTLVDVVLPHVTHIRERGLTLTGPGGAFTVHLPAYTPKELKGTFKRVFLCVKAHQTAEATRQLYRHLAEDGYVVSAQRGINEHTIAQLVGANRTIGAFLNFGSVYKGPGEVQFTHRGVVAVGELDGTIRPRTEGLRDIMRALEPDAQVTDNIWGWLWAGLAHITLMYATALTQEPIAEVLAMEEFQPLFYTIGVEVMSTALLEKVVVMPFNGFDPDAFVPSAEPEQIVASIAAMVAFARTSAKTHSDMWTDLAVHHRKTEVDAHIGTILDVAARHDLDTPVIRRIMTMVHEIEEGRRPQALVNLDELARIVDPNGAPRLS